MSQKQAFSLELDKVEEFWDGQVDSFEEVFFDYEVNVGCSTNETV